MQKCDKIVPEYTKKTRGWFLVLSGVNIGSYQFFGAIKR